MPNYANGKIYRIIDNTNGNQYIGSTTQSLSRRLQGHKMDFKCYNNNKKKNNCASLKIIENGDYNIILIEKFKCESKEELVMKERHFQDIMPNINKCKAYRSKEEKKQIGKDWKKDNEDYKQKQKIYRKANKDHFDKYRSEYRKTYNAESIICECGGKYKKDNRSAHFKTLKHQNFLN